MEENERINKKISIVPISAEEYKNLTISYATANTNIGEVLIASTEKGICYLAPFTNLSAAIDDLKKRFPKAHIIKRKNNFHQDAVNCINLEFSTINTLSLHVKGTDFQLKVWKELLNIPSGETCTYGQIAKNIKDPKAVRAVGTAIGKNPVSVIIPCHRVIRSSGELGGYYWGKEMKKRILETEKK